jgi:hypothetical protein
MPAQQIRQITLDTGHVRLTPRSEVGDEIVAMLQGCIEQMLEGRFVPVTNTDMVLSAQARGTCLLLEATHKRTLALLATIGVATTTSCAAALWREVHAGTRGTATSVDQCPEAPWVAARLRPDIAKPENLECASLLGDLERCIAWTWIEHPAAGP